MTYIVKLLLIFLFIFSGCSHKKESALRKSLMMPKKSEIVGNENFKKKEKQIEKMRRKRMKKKR